MMEAIGRGWLGSIRRRVAAEIRTHLKNNTTIRDRRYSFAQRALRFALVGRQFSWFIMMYLWIDLAALIAEHLLIPLKPSLSQIWASDAMKGVLKDAAGYLITAQVGILGVISVAVGLVTLIAQRDDQSGSNSDIRLYYVEALAYGLVSSSLALLVILCVQVFWPLQFVLHILGFGSVSLIFKVPLTALHVAWLSINLCGFVQFITASLRFVEPTARERMRERYTANIVVPADLTERLLRVSIPLTAKAVNPQTEAEKSLLLSLGHDVMDDGVVEIRSSFADKHILWDVRSTILGFALRSWWKRTERWINREGIKGPRSSVRNDVWLSFSPSFDREFDGSVSWCRRRGGLPLLAREKYLIRLSFLFRKVPAQAPRDLPTPETFLEELSAKVIGQIDRLAIAGFKAALDEMTRYHRFLLDVHESRSAGDHLQSLAEVGGIWISPHENWVSQYRRVIERATEKLSVEPDFIERLSYLPLLLLPSNATSSSSSTVRSLLDLGLLQAVFMEAWVTRRTTVDVAPGAAAQPRLGLPGSDRLVYERVLLNFVGAWESVLRQTEYFFQWKQAGDESIAARWVAMTASWPFVERHLRNSAYMLALAVWNEDASGADRYRDMLLRWIDTIKPGADDVYIFWRHKAILTPEVFALEWGLVERHLEPFVKDTPNGLQTSDTLFFLVLRRAFDDALAVTAGVVLSWCIENQQASGIGGEVAGLLLQRRLLDDDGARRRTDSAETQSAFQSVFWLIVRAALTPRLKDGRYGASLDGLVSYLDQMSERRVVPGRIYSSFRRNGLDAISTAILALLVASMPAVDDCNLINELQAFAANDDLVGDDDATLRRIEFEFQGLMKSLNDESNKANLTRGVHLLSPDIDIDSVAPRLTAFFSGVISAIGNERTLRLRRLPLDTKKLDRLQKMLEAAQNSIADELHVFSGVQVIHSQSPGSTAEEYRVGRIDKGEFTIPNMSAMSTGSENLLRDIFRQGLAQFVWFSFSKLSHRTVEVCASDYPNGYWQRVILEGRAIGPDAVLLVPNTPTTTDLTNWMYKLRNEIPAGLKVEHLDGRGNGGGLAYIATVNGIDVYVAVGMASENSLLISSRSLVSITYSTVPEKNTFVSLRLEESEDPRNGTLAISFCQSMTWDASTTIEFKLVGLDPKSRP